MNRFDRARMLVVLVRMLRPLVIVLGRSGRLLFGWGNALHKWCVAQLEAALEKVNE